MEKLLDLAADERFDLVVLDTPPTRHALDFLEAPERLMGFLDTSVLRWFLKPYFVAGRLTLKVATRTGAFVLKLADRVLGLQFLQDLSEFFLAFEGMYAGFKERAAQVHELLRRDDAGFVLVAGPSALTLDEALYFHRRLVEREMPFVGFVVNRLHPVGHGFAGPRRPPPTSTTTSADRLVEVFKDYSRLSKAEMKNVARLEDETGSDAGPGPRARRRRARPRRPERGRASCCSAARRPPARRGARGRDPSRPPARGAAR